MTAPNPTAVNVLTVPVATLPEHGGLSLGFRQAWVEAESDGVEANLTSGAGLGSPYLILAVHREGKPTITEAIDVRDVLPGWINTAIARADAPMAEGCADCGSAPGVDCDPFCTGLAAAKDNA